MGGVNDARRPESRWLRSRMETGLRRLTDYRRGSNLQYSPVFFLKIRLRTVGIIIVIKVLITQRRYILSTDVNSILRITIVSLSVFPQRLLILPCISIFRFHCMVLMGFVQHLLQRTNSFE